MTFFRRSHLIADPTKRSIQWRICWIIFISVSSSDKHFVSLKKNTIRYLLPYDIFKYEHLSREIERYDDNKCQIDLVQPSDHEELNSELSVRPFADGSHWRAEPWQDELAPLPKIYMYILQLQLVFLMHISEVRIAIYFKVFVIFL